MMKAPSPSCLRALRLICYSPEPARCQQGIRRSLATTANLRNSKTTPKPPKTTLNPVLPAHKPLAQAPPPAISRPPSEPGYVTRRRSDDDGDFVPQPLSRPIGMPNPPQPGENWGRDTRSIKQRRDDFVNYDKHIQKRAKMTRQIAKPYFRDWSNMRFQEGKIFVANERLFRAEHALFFPNFFGCTLRKGVERRVKTDGYGGRGRSTTSVMGGKISIVSLVSNQWAVDQVNTFCSASQNPELHRIIKQNPNLVQRVEINHEDNVLKWWILRLFGMRALRQERTPEQQERYFVVRRGVSAAMKEAIGLLNDKGGYVYMVDPEYRIRWAGSANARESERDSMIKGLRRLVQEVRGGGSEIP